jgi:hypothetical protein
MKKIIILLLLIIPLFGISQSRTIQSNFNYLQIEKKVHNQWTKISSKFEDNKFIIDEDNIFWTSPKKSKQYYIESVRIFEGNLIYVVRDYNNEIMVFKLIENDSISILWLDEYSRRLEIVFDIVDY